MDNPGRISKAGDPDVRCALYTAVHPLVSRSASCCTPKAWGMRLVKSRGHRRAVVAVARKLAVILHRMWIDGSDFRWGSMEAKVWCELLTNTDPTGSVRSVDDGLEEAATDCCAPGAPVSEALHSCLTNACSVPWLTSRLRKEA
jgi:hypothetical protein